VKQSNKKNTKELPPTGVEPMTSSSRNYTSEALLPLCKMLVYGFLLRRTGKLTSHEGYSLREPTVMEIILGVRSGRNWKEHQLIHNKRVSKIGQWKEARVLGHETRFSTCLTRMNIQNCNPQRINSVDNNGSSKVNQRSEWPLYGKSSLAWPFWCLLMRQFWGSSENHWKYTMLTCPPQQRLSIAPWSERGPGIWPWERTRKLLQRAPFVLT